MCFFWCYIGKYRDHTFCSKGHHRHNLVIVSGIQINASVCHLHQSCNLWNISACFFDRHNIFYIFCKIYGCLRLDVAAGSARYVIENDRQFYRLCDCCIVCDQSVLCCFIIIRCYQKKGICSCLLCLLGKVDGSCCTIRTGSGDNRDSLCHFFNGIADHIQMFLMCQCGWFSGGSADNDGICAACDLLFQNLT